MKKYFLLFTVLSVLFVSCSTVKQNDKPSTLLWEVRAKDDSNKVMYLLGSIHIATKDMYPLSPKIMEAWDKTDVLGVEVDINNSASMLQDNFSLVAKLFSPTEKLYDKMPNDTYTKLKNKMIDVGIPEEMVDMLTPLGAALMIDMGDYINQVSNSTDAESIYANEGIDQYFLNKATESNKSIVELESVNTQINALESMNEFIIDYINTTLNSNSLDENDNTLLFKAWKNGDIEFIEKTINTMSENPEINKKMNDILINSRNINMTKKIEQYFNDNKTYFIVIGAGHFVGENGIIKTLEKKGNYTIIRK